MAQRTSRATLASAPCDGLRGMLSRLQAEEHEPVPREAPSRSIGYFQRIHAAAPLTGRTESSSSDYLAPHVGLEPSTIRLTAEPIVGLGPFILENSVLGTQFTRYSAISAPACRARFAFSPQPRSVVWSAIWHFLALNGTLWSKIRAHTRRGPRAVDRPGGTRKKPRSTGIVIAP